MSLTGLKVTEFGSLAPVPFAGMVLADYGASVIRVDKPSASSADVLCRGKRSIAINLKRPTGRDVLKKLISSSDVLIDPFRPGVMEKLHLGPDTFLGEGGSNPKLIYARIVGFPRTGPHRHMAGHDINFLALSGVLPMLPGQDKPNFPLNILADIAGGGLVAVLGILLALIERRKSGKGQIVEVDMVSGVRYVASFPLLHSLLPVSPLFARERGKNLIDGGAPYYDIYTCSDGLWMSVGCLEATFFKSFITKFIAALPKDFNVSNGWRPTVNSQNDASEWPKLREFLTMGFLTNVRDYWTEIFHGTDACVLPVITASEARAYETSKHPFPSPHPKIKTGCNVHLMNLTSMRKQGGNLPLMALLERILTFIFVPNYDNRGSKLVESYCRALE